MAKLNQIIAVETGVKDDATAAVTIAVRALGADEAALYGLTRTYETREDVDADVRVEERPDERVKVQVVAEEMVRAMARSLVRLFDVTLTKETADASARADVVVAGNNGQPFTLLADAPVTYLLFLEKQVKRIKGVLAQLPVLDPAVDWHPDANTGLWRTDPAKKTSGKKVPRNHVRFAGDEHHPPQVDVWQEDVIVGDWTLIRFSGAVPEKRKQLLLDRCDRLLRAVVSAREEANSITVTDRAAGSAVLDWLLA